MGLAKKTIKIESKTKNGKVEIFADLERTERNINKAQFILDRFVLNSMKPFMPLRDGNFIQLVTAQNAAIAGSGKVIAAVPPQGRYLYYGKTMVDEKTGSPWARQSAKKVLVSQFAGKTNAREDLVISKSHNPKAQSHWFDAAKKQDLKEWIKAIKEAAGGNVNG